MGPLPSKLAQGLSSYGEHQARIVLLGFDAAGKTTILYRLKLNKNVTTTPTIGFNVEDVKVSEDVILTIWDVGGQEEIRHLWQHYYKGADGLIFVVDASDVVRLREAGGELFSVLKDENIEKGVPVVIMANKEDLPNALKSHELIDKMGLGDLKENSWYVQEVCATSGEGLNEGIDIMADMVKVFQRGRLKKP